MRQKQYSHRESNPDQRFRKPPFYPLNYRSNYCFLLLINVCIVPNATHCTCKIIDFFPIEEIIL